MRHASDEPSLLGSDSLRADDDKRPADEALAEMLCSLAFGTSQVMVTELVDSDRDRRAC
jgi:hypothetical protein